MITMRSAHAERAVEHARQLVDVVADDGLQPDVVADRVQPLGDEQRVGVDAERRQHLAADREDAGFHNRVIGQLVIGSSMTDYQITR